MAAEMKATRRVSVRLTKRDFKLAISRQEVGPVNLETLRAAPPTSPSCLSGCGGERFAGIECRLLFLTADDQSESAYTSVRQRDLSSRTAAPRRVD